MYLYPLSFYIGVENRLVKRPAFGVIHAQHDGDDVGLERTDVALQVLSFRVDGPVSDHHCATHGGIDKLHLQIGKPRAQVSLNRHRVVAAG